MLLLIYACRWSDEYILLTETEGRHQFVPKEVLEEAERYAKVGSMI
jgi:hypothetical protein